MVKRVVELRELLEIAKKISEELTALEGLRTKKIPPTDYCKYAGRRLRQEIFSSSKTIPEPQHVLEYLFRITVIGYGQRRDIRPEIIQENFATGASLQDKWRLTKDLLFLRQKRSLLSSPYRSPFEYPKRAASLYLLFRGVEKTFTTALQFYQRGSGGERYCQISWSTYGWKSAEEMLIGKHNNWLSHYLEVRSQYYAFLYTVLDDEELWTIAGPWMEQELIHLLADRLQHIEKIRLSHVSLPNNNLLSEWVSFIRKYLQGT